MEVDEKHSNGKSNKDESLEMERQLREKALESLNQRRKESISDQ
jgi:hypothetical protein